MSNKEFFVELYQSANIDSMRFGVIEVSLPNIHLARAMSQQSMPVDDIHFQSVKKSIIEDGFNSAYPLCLHSKTMKTLDGFTRLTASIEAVGEGYFDSIMIPFYTSTSSPESFNSASRGTSAEDIARFFKISRVGGLLTGSSKRAAEQSIEASQMLDVAKLGCLTKAFQSGKEQRHTSKIVRESDVFAAGFSAVCDVATSINKNPDKLKWAHWMALFCRYGVNNTTKGVAANCIIENTGSTQEHRYRMFEKCSEEAFKLGGL